MAQQVNLIINSVLDSKENFKTLLAPQAGLLMVDTEGQQVIEDKIVSGIKIGNGVSPWEDLEYLPLDPDTADVWRKLVSTSTSNAQLITLPTVNFSYLTVSADTLSNAQYESLLHQVLKKDLGFDISTEEAWVWSAVEKKNVQETSLKIIANGDYMFLRGVAGIDGTTVDRITFNESDSEKFTILFRDSATAASVKALEQKVQEDLSEQLAKTEEKISTLKTTVDSFQKTENILGGEGTPSNNYGMVMFPTGAAANKADYFLAADGEWRQIALNTTNITYQNKNLDTVLTELINRPVVSAVKAYSGTQYGTTYVASLRSMPSSQGTTTDTLIVNKGVKIDNTNSVLYGATWNDLAEFREADKHYAAGYCLVDCGGSLSFSKTDRNPNCYIVSDTFGFVFGPETPTSVPVALAGRVLAYAENRNKLREGDAVCSSKCGTIRKMRWWEKILFPQSIVGFVSEIPTYDYWGEHRTLVNGRVWIRVR